MRAILRHFCCLKLRDVLKSATWQSYDFLLSSSTMPVSATFHNIALSTAFDPNADKSLLSLNWVLTHGIRVLHSVASGHLTLPCVASDDLSLEMNLPVASSLPFDLVFG
ncbi:hypothetical protein B0H13DRAFT_2300824 [Mycena leptocephala]|nr:hypothetical protein B0H13DRAFT_2300824 [Mycena leptocephala]